MAVGNVPLVGNESGTLERGTGKGKQATLVTKNKQAFYNRLKSEYYDNVYKAINTYYKDVAKKQQTFEEESSSFNIFEQALKYANMLINAPTTLTFDLISGMLSGGSDAVFGVVQYTAKFIEDVKSIFDETDGTGWQEDLRYTVTSIPADIAKGLGTAGIGIAAGASEFLNSIWAPLGDEDAIETWGAQASQWVEDTVNTEIIGRALEIEKYKEQAYEGKSSLYQSPNQVKSEFDDPDFMRKYIDDRYKNEDYVNFIGDTIQYNNWFQENIAKPLGEQGDQYYPPEYKQWVEPALNSIGRLIPSVALSFVSPKAGAKGLATTLAGLSKAYFVSNTYGASYREAVNAGASLNDAHIYAVGNAGLELGTEMIGGWVPGQFSPKSMSSVLKNIGTETFEEMLAELAGNSLNIYLNKEREIENVDPAELRSRVLYSALVGGFSGGVFGGIGKIQAASMIETDVDAINTELDKIINPKDEKKKQEINQENLTEATQKLVEKLNDPKTPQWRKDQILKNRIIKSLVEQQTIKGEQIVYDAKTKTSSVQETETTSYTLSKVGQKLKEGKLVSTQGEIEITKDDFAVGSQEYVSDYIEEIEVGEQVVDAQGNPKQTSRKIKIKILDNQEVQNLNDDQKKDIEWFKKRNLRVAIVSAPKNAGFAAYTDVKTGMIYINVNSKNNESGFKNMYAHEMHDKINIMFSNGLLSKKQFDAYVDFVKSIDAGTMDKILSKIGWTDVESKYLNDLFTPEQKEQAKDIGEKNVKLTPEQNKIITREKISWVIGEVFDNERILREAYGENPSVFRRIANIFANPNKFKTQFGQVDATFKKMLDKMQKNFQKLLKEGSSFAYGYETIGEGLRQVISLDPQKVFAYNQDLRGTIYADSFQDIIDATKNEQVIRKVIGLNEGDLSTRILINNYNSKTDKLNIKEGILSFQENRIYNLLYNGVKYFDGENIEKQNYDSKNGADYFLKIGDKLYDRNKFIIPEDESTMENIVVRFVDNNHFEISYERKEYNEKFDTVFEEADGGVMLGVSNFNVINIYPDVILPDGSVKENPQMIISSLNPGFVNDLISKDGKGVAASFAFAPATSYLLPTQQFQRLFQDGGHAFTITAVLKPEILSKPGVFVMNEDGFTPIRIFSENEMQDGPAIYEDLGVNPQEETVLKKDTEYLPRDGVDFVFEDYFVVKNDKPIDVMKQSLESMIERVDSELSRVAGIVETGKEVKVDFDEVKSNITYTILQLSKIAKNLNTNTTQETTLTPSYYKNKMGTKLPSYIKVVQASITAAMSMTSIFTNTQENGMLDLFQIGQALSVAINPETAEATKQNNPDAYNMYIENQMEFDDVADYYGMLELRTSETVVEGQASTLDIADDYAVVNINHIGGNLNSNYYQKIKSFFESKGVSVVETNNTTPLEISANTDAIYNNINGKKVYDTTHPFFKDALGANIFAKADSQRATQSISENIGREAIQTNNVFAYDAKPKTKKQKKKTKLLDDDRLNAKETEQNIKSKTKTTKNKFNQPQVKKTVQATQTQEGINATLDPVELRKTRILTLESLKTQLKTAEKNRAIALDNNNSKGVIKYANQVKRLKMQIERMETLLNEETAPKVQETPVQQTAPVETTQEVPAEETQPAPVEQAQETETEPVETQQPEPVEQTQETQTEEVVVQEEVNDAPVGIEELQKAHDISKRQSKITYKGLQKAFKKFLDSVFSEIENQNEQDFKDIVSLFKKHNIIIQRNIRGTQYINHLSESVLKALIQELAAKKLAAKKAEARTDLVLTNPEIQAIVNRVYEAVFSAMAQMDDITSRDYITEDNLTGRIYNRFTHRFLRKFMEADMTNEDVRIAMNNDPDGEFLIRLINAIYNINDENGIQELNGAIEQFIRNTEVEKVSTLSLNENGTLRTISKVKEEWRRNTKQIKKFAQQIGYKIDLPRYLGKTKMGNYAALLDPYTFLEIQSLFNEFGWGNVLSRKIEEGVERQIDVDRIFERIIQEQGWLRKNFKDLKKFDSPRKTTVIENLFGAKLTMSQIISLRNLILREVLRNKAIDLGIILGEKSTHFENGNRIDILALVNENADKLDRAQKVKIKDQMELLNELNNIVENNTAAKELSNKIMTFFSELYPLINERYSEINGQPLQSEGIELKEAIEAGLVSEEDVLGGLPANITIDMLDKIYIPIYVGEAGYFREKNVKFKDILDLGVSDGFTQAIGDSNAIVKVDSIINIMYKYKKEARNYWGLHRVMQNWSDLVNTALEISPMEKAEDQKQQVNMQEYISQNAIIYVEEMLKDLAGYKRGYTVPALAWLRKNFYRAVLAANVKVILTQLTTMYNLAVLYGDNFATFFPKMYKNLFMQLSPKNRQELQQLKDRNNIYYDRTFAPTYDIGQAQSEGTNIFGKIINIMMSGISITDTSVNKALFLTLLETKNRETGVNYTKEEADKILKKGILRSQSSALDLGKAPILRTENEIWKTLLKFMGEPLKLQSQIYASKKQLELIRKMNTRNKEQGNKTNEAIFKEEVLQLEAQAIEKLQNERQTLEQLKSLEESEDFATLENEEQQRIRDNIKIQAKRVEDAVALAEDTSAYARTTIEQIDEIIAGKPKAQEMMRRRIAALMGTMMYMAALNTIWYAILRDMGNLDDREEEEELSQYLARKFGANLFGEFFQLFPFIRDIYGFLESGFDFSTIDEIAMLEQTLEIVSEFSKAIIEGEEINPLEIARKFGAYGLRVFGFPGKNIENIFVAYLMLSGNKDTYYRYRTITGQRTASNKELEQAIREGNDEMVQAIVESKIASRNVNVSTATLDEIVNLGRVGVNVSIPGIKDSYTIDGVEYTMDEKQSLEFRRIYNQADLVVQRMITSSSYRRLNDKKKKSLIQSIFNYYLKLAQSEVFDLDLVPDNRMFRSLTQAFNYFRETVATRLLNEQRKEERESRRR